MKIISLSAIALCLIGAIYFLLHIDSELPVVPEPAFENERANEWKAQINALCQPQQWSTKGYRQVVEKIHADRINSQEELLNQDDEQSLLKYLYALSCSLHKEQADAHFKQETYSRDRIAQWETAWQFLQEGQERWGKNSNLTHLSMLLTEYRQLVGWLHFERQATYTQPLRAFSAPSAETIRQRIERLTLYDSHFSRNVDIRARMKGLSSQRYRAEESYYNRLEQCVEKAYRSSGNLEQLLDDQLQFMEISTNESAVERLNTFINHSHPE